MRVHYECTREEWLDWLALRAREWVGLAVFAPELIEQHLGREVYPMMPTTELQAHMLTMLRPIRIAPVLPIFQEILRRADYVP